MLQFQTSPYLELSKNWPESGRHILAQYDDEAIIVYQAYRPEIGEYAVAHQRFGGAFKFTRMSWIKPNFLWMMYRAGWASKPGQEMILAVTIPRSLFDEILVQAIPSTFTTALFPDRETWQQAVAARPSRP